MNIDETMSFINSFSKSGKPITDLSRAKELMKLIGNPEKKLKFIHIAGTNGKGSTLEYISNALIYSNYKTGQFTSPFVMRYNDRIRINGEEIEEDSLCKVAEFIKSRITGEDYSQFEITMAIAFLWFLREKCDIVVLETGIGGLLDSTNVIPSPILSVITSISLDHTDILGDTVEKIAYQKAGIIKADSAVVCSKLNDSSIIDIIKNVAKSRGAKFICIDDSFEMNENSFREPLKKYLDKQRSTAFIYKKKEYRPKMMGKAQIYNALTAIEACYYLREKGFNIADDKIKKSIEETRVKARMQYIEGNPPVIVDGGHNINGVVNLYYELKNYCYYGINRYIVMGMVDTKDYIPCTEIIARCSDSVFTVDGFAPNAVKAEKLAEVAAEYTNAQACSCLEKAVENARTLALKNDGIVVICGSLYLASEYLKKYEK